MHGSNFIEQRSTRKLFWLEIIKMLNAVLKRNNFIVSFVRVA